jgi:uncharacterized membrane protein YfcA
VRARAHPRPAPVVTSRPGASSDAQAETAGPAAAVVAVTPSAPALFGHALPEGLWRRRWLLIVVVWGAAALALYVSPFGERMNPYLSLTGLFVGFLVGLTGMGGGALLTPILIFFFGFQPTLAIGTDITYAAVTKVFGSWRHFKQKTVDWRLALWLALGSIPAGLTGAYAVNYMKENYGEAIDEVLYMAIGSALMLVGVLLVIRIAMKLDRHYPVQDLRMSVPRKVATVFVGAATGFIIGLTSVGSGTLLAMALILFYPLATQRVVGTDVFHATLLLGATGLAQLRFGNVDLPMVAALLIGSIPGVIVGSHLTVRTSTRALRGVLAAVLFLSGLALLFKA